MLKLFTTKHFDICLFAKPMDNAPVSGDSYFYQEADDQAFFGVIDGLGHGDNAHKAAAAAMEYFESKTINTLDRDLFFGCHQALLGTRGAVASVVLLDAARRLFWSGIGNVAGICLNQCTGRVDGLIAANGCLGHFMPDYVQTYSIPCEGNSLILLYTDGAKLRAPFENMVFPEDETQAHQGIQDNFELQNDDVLILLLRAHDTKSL